MNPALRVRWNELAPWLDRALELAADARPRYIASIDVDPALRRLLHELLDDAEAPGILDGDSGRYAQSLLREDSPSQMPREIGPYRILRLLGEGGSGSVFLAEREADGYVQRVALKLLRFGVRDPVEQERFRRERRILARLEHPHIARLLDGGFTPDGVPWFALDYIDGEPLIAWCDARKLDLAARLRLFDDICEAVAHAHRALVVHRDLKPANILVDADGRAHLLDFGIARLLDPTANEDATQTGQRRMTPAYAAPEQFAGGTITTATDVYALGVLLHELLSGLRPQREGDADIPLPSSVLAAEPRREALAAARSSTAQGLSRMLRGDLDTLISTALAHAPERRYASVEALAEDVRRYRGQHPVLARRSSVAYRTRKFLRRHRSAAALVVLLLLSLVTGIAATLREARHARAAAETAQREADRAAAVKEFVLALFAGVTPDESRGRAIGARELLERGEARLTETLAAQPQLEAELSTVLAGAWRQLGSHERAATLARRALQVANDAASRNAAGIELGAVLVAQGQFDAAEAACAPRWPSHRIAPVPARRAYASRNCSPIVVTRTRHSSCSMKRLRPIAMIPPHPARYRCTRSVASVRAILRVRKARFAMRSIAHATCMRSRTPKLHGASTIWPSYSCSVANPAMPRTCSSARLRRAPCCLASAIPMSPRAASISLSHASDSVKPIQRARCFALHSPFNANCWGNVIPT